MIIYSPHIGDTVPGFISSTIKIPFTDNSAVGQYDGIACRVMEFNNNNPLGEKLTTTEIENGIAVFNSSALKFTQGNYYKFQIAYYEGATEKVAGPYSSIAIGRCIDTEKPTLNLIKDTNSNFTGTYTYSLSSEPIYEYCFDFTKENQLIYSTGWQFYSDIPEIDKEENNIATLKAKLNQELETGIAYRAKLTIRTVNGYEDTANLSFVKEGELPILADLSVSATQDMEAQDNGFVRIQLGGTPTTGSFELLRRAHDSNVWEKIADIKLNTGSNLKDFTWKDCSVEHGTTYIYAIRRSGAKVSNKIFSAPITVAFEDMFLSDAEKQLKIRFNPKVSSFKNTILEQKVDTIGGKYPFFFRNGQVKYKEIPISGLLSYQMDEANLFMSNDELGVFNPVGTRNSTTTSSNDEVSAAALKTTNLVDYNIAAEKRFKLAVLEWLTNGKPKLFRSPTEGNYVVRVMNTSLSPNETLGRMLHTFSATGYECGDSDYQSLQDQNIVAKDQVIEDKLPAPAVKTIRLYDGVGTVNDKGEEVIEDYCWNIVYETSVPTSNTKITIDKKDEIINTTGRIIIPSANEISWKKADNEYSTITYIYYPKVKQEKDEYNTMINNSTDIVETLSSGDNDLSNYHWIYSLTLIPNPQWGYNDNNEWVLKNAEEDNNELQVTIDGNIIDLSDGNTRYYYDLQISKIKLGASVEAVIYGRKGQGEN